MKCRKSQQSVSEMSSAQIAAGYVRRMVEEETRGWGDQKNALDRVCRRNGLPFGTMENLRTGRVKSVEAGLMARIRGAYLDLCQRQVARLQHTIAVEKAKHEDDDLADLAADAAALAARIQAKKEALKA